jgi:DNA-binding response OmpR family regulator
VATRGGLLPYLHGVTMKILLVEDDCTFGAIIVDLFERAAHQVRVARSGTSALEMLQEWTPDVVVTDLGLPGVRGEEVARVAGELAGRPRVVAMSGERERLDLMRASVDAVLLKPFPMSELLRIVELFY